MGSWTGGPKGPIYYNGGNVGIGTAEPLNKLHVAQDIPGDYNWTEGSAQLILSGTSNSAQQLRLGFDTNNNAAFVQSTIWGSSGNDLILNGAGGNVGVGTLNPACPLSVSGNAYIVSGSLGFNRNPPDGSLPPGGNGNSGRYQITPYPDGLHIEGYNASGVNTGLITLMATSGYVGVGTTTPASQLHVDGSAPGTLGPTLNLANQGGGENAAVAIDFNTYSLDSRGGVAGAGPYNPSSRIEASGHAGSFSDDLIFLFNQPGIPNHGLQEAMRVNSTGLQVSGNLNAATINTSGNINVAGDILLTGADCAEDFDAGIHPPEPGTVVVIDEKGALRKSSEAYDTKVVGVVSGAGEFRPGLVLDKRSSEEGRIPVALMGKVYCQVDAQYSPIEVGDLLTTSPTLGHAMKAVEAGKAFGAVIGKALRPLERGRGLIPVLVALQ